MLDRLPELIAFVQSVQAGSFSAAARILNTTPSAVSKRVAKLEDRLGVRLLQRTTRSLNLTTDGTAYYEKVARLLIELEEANELVISNGKPRGKLKITAPLHLGRRCLAQWIPEFLDRYPELQIDLRLTDSFVDLIEEGIDVAIRIGNLEDSSLIRQHLGTTRHAVYASPSYLEKHGTPATPEELIHHNCLRYVSRVNTGHLLPWKFVDRGVLKEIPVKGNFDSDNVDSLIVAALSGLGIIYVLDFHVEAEIGGDRLKLLFADRLPSGPIIQAVFTHQRHLSPKVRVLLEFLSDRYREIDRSIS
ncbi:MAG: LysR substrate-binding domain-containing protein [Xenococcaceae cyanobacterium]